MIGYWDDLSDEEWNRHFAWLERQTWLDERGYTLWDAVSGMLCAYDTEIQPPRVDPDDWEALLLLVMN